MICHTRDIADLMTQDPLPKPADNRLADLDDIVLFDEGHLNIKLGEFRLAISTEIFIPIATGNLEIALHSGNHQ